MCVLSFVLVLGSPARNQTRHFVPSGVGEGVGRVELTLIHCGFVAVHLFDEQIREAVEFARMYGLAQLSIM